jgi:cytochrome c5
MLQSSMRLGKFRILNRRIKVYFHWLKFDWIRNDFMVVRLRLFFLLLFLSPFPLTILAADLTERQAQLLANNCVQCHARADIGAPIMGNAADWEERSRKGEDKLLANVIVGLRGMPPLGYCSACGEQDFRALIRFMAALPKPAVAPDAAKGGGK